MLHVLQPVVPAQLLTAKAIQRARKASTNLLTCRCYGYDLHQTVLRALTHFSTTLCLHFSFRGHDFVSTMSGLVTLWMGTTNYPANDTQLFAAHIAHAPGACVNRFDLAGKWVPAAAFALQLGDPLYFIVFRMRMRGFRSNEKQRNTRRACKV